MKRFVRDVVIAVTSLGLALPMVAFAQRNPRRGPPGSGALVRVLDANSERLGLQASVLQQIRVIAEAERKSVSALEERKRSAHRAMRALLDAPVPDESKVMAQADVLGEIDVELHKERLRSLIGIRRLLSEDQLAELNEIQQERRAQMRKRHGERGHRGSGSRGEPGPSGEAPPAMP